jgi:hypothetical protein
MSLATDGGVIQKAMDMVKIIAPLPGEQIKPDSEEPATDEDADIIESEEDTPTEPEEDLKEEE